MPLKFQVSDLSNIDESLKGLYKKCDDGMYTLSVDGIPASNEEDITGLKNKNAELILKNKKLKDLQAQRDAEKVLELQEIEDKNLAAIAANGNNSEILAAMKQKLEATENKGKLQIDKLQNDIKLMEQSRAKDSINSFVTKLAVQLSGDKAQLIMPHLKERVSVEDDGSIAILDKDGKQSIMTEEDLKTEFKNNKLFSSVISGSKASGGAGINTVGSVFLENNGASKSIEQKLEDGIKKL